MIDQVRRKNIPGCGASEQLDRILARKHRFHSVIIIFGYFLSSIGLTMLFRPDLRALLMTGSMGILVGLMVLWFQKQPRFNLLLPVFAAVVVSTLVFNITRLGYIFGSANLLIPPLIVFFPGQF